MKGALDEYLKGGAEDVPMDEEGDMTPTDDDLDSMFAEDRGVEEEDPLQWALSQAGFQVDEAKLAQIRGILEESEDDPADMGEEMDAEGGMVPEAMKGKGY